MAAVVASASTVVLGSPTIDARLNLSLDDLIKERRKETKKEVQQQKKRESVKQEQASPSKKADAQQLKKKAAANAQSGKRKDKMNKNRGLPAVQLQTQQKKKQNGSNNQNASANVPSKAAKKLLLKKAKKTAAMGAGRNTPIPKAKQQPLQQQKFKNQNSNAKRNGNNSPSPKHTNQQQQFKQFQQFKSTPPTLSPKQQTKKTMTFTVKPTKGMRAVNKTAKGNKLQITLVRSDADLRRTKKQKQFETQRQTVAVPAKKKMSAKAAKALLPGKAQPKTRKVLAQTLVKQAKRSVASRKQWTSKNGKFVVRKPVMVRRA